MKPRRRFARRLEIEELEPRTLPSAGALDTSFSGDGIASLSSSLTATDVAVQPDGKAVVVGSSKRAIVFPNGNTFDETMFAVARFNLDGSLDGTFGTGGLVRTQLSDLAIGESSANAIAIAPNGRIVVVGKAVRTEGIEIEDEVAIAVYKPDGTLDETFDGNGLRTFDLGSSGISGGARDTVGHDVAVQADGKIVVVGMTEIDSDSDFFAIRLRTDGQLDEDESFFPTGFYKGFAGDGKTSFAMGGDDIAQAVKIGSNGEVFIAGSVNNVDEFNVLQRRIGIVRLNTFGERIEIFDADGMATFDLPGDANIRDMILQADGKMVVAGGTRNGDFLVARFTGTGQLDPTFGGQGTGFATTDVGGFDIVGGMTPAPLGTGNGFIVSGISLGRFAAVKYTQDGLLDTAFGTDGKAHFNVGVDHANIARGPGRRFMLAGGPDFTTARVLDTGANVVHATAFGDPSGSEAGIDQASFFVFRQERLPFATRVFFSVGGTATFSNFFGSDYQLSGLTVPTSGKDLRPYVDIAANQTFTVVTLAPIDDTLVEGTETAVFTIQPSSSYDIGTPSSAELTIRDNDFNFIPIKSLGTGVLTPSAAELPANGEINYTLQWTTPGVWRDLDTIELRIVVDGIAVAWIRWDETTNALSLRDPVTGLFTQSGQPGAKQKLKAGGVDLDLRNTTVVGSGPLGQSVTLTLALKLHAKKPHGLTGPPIYRLEIFASDDDGNRQGFDEVGTLRFPS